MSVRVVLPSATLRLVRSGGVSVYVAKTKIDALFCVTVKPVSVTNELLLEMILVVTLII